MIVKMFLINLFFAIQLPIQSTKSGNISIHFSGIEQWKGTVLIHLFNNSKGFPNNSQYATRTFLLDLDSKSKTFQIPNLPYGEYAISSFHDANNNQKLDTNFFGIPKENVGTSNNPPSGGIPSYKDAKFILDKKKLTLSIKLK